MKISKVAEFKIWSHFDSKSLLGEARLPSTQSQLVREECFQIFSCWK